MSLAAKNESAVRAWPQAMPLETMAGPFAAAAILPAAAMMAGFVTVWGVGFGLASAFATLRRDRLPAPVNDEPALAAAPAVRLVVANDEPLVDAAKPATPKDGGLKTPGPGVPPKPAKPGGAPPKPKAMAAAPVTVAETVVAATKPATPKDGGLKTPGPGVPPKPAKPGGAPPKPKAMAAAPVTVAETLVAATKPATPKDGGLKTPGPGVPPKPAKPGSSPPKPKSAAAQPAARRKATPAVTVAPLKIEAKATSKGISLPRVSIQDDKADGPQKT
ncbi:hypothetical protein [Phreatobacter sp.]|uniref:hypothetical protein n=1 Tax=Phreatobacter sp. TaxID=1966341 RepID=UPI003F72C46F